MVLWFHQPPLPLAMAATSLILPWLILPVLGATALYLSWDGFQALLCSGSHGRMEDVCPQHYTPGNPGLGHSHTASSRRNGTVPSVRRMGR